MTSDFKVQIIPKEKLIDGHLYLGEGRLGRYAVWNEKKGVFMWMSVSFGQDEVNYMKYGNHGFDPMFCLGGAYDGE